MYTPTPTFPTDILLLYPASCHLQQTCVLGVLCVCRRVSWCILCVQAYVLVNCACVDVCVGVLCVSFLTEPPAVV